MSVFPDIKHLYDDVYFGSAGLVLDAKDRLKTRELNAREKRYFDQQMCVLDRAKDICVRSRNWEHHHLQDQLGHISLRTPTFNQRLINKVRKKVTAECIGTDINNVSRNLTVPRIDAGKQSYHNFVDFESPENTRTQLKLPVINRHSHNYVQRSPLWYSESPSACHKRPGTHQVKAASSSHRRRSDHVVKALARLYIRSDKRRELLTEKLESVKEAEPGSFHYRSYMALKSTEDTRLTEENLQAFLDAASDYEYEETDWEKLSLHSD